MSTKIFDAWKWEGDFYSLNRELIEIKKEIQDSVFIEVKKYLASTAWEIVDTIKLYKTEYNTRTEKFESYVKDTYGVNINENLDFDSIFEDVLYAEMNELKRYEDSPNIMDGEDFSVSATIFPYKPNIQLMMLFIHHNESREAINKILSKHGFKEYSYNNQVDCPEEISESEWKERELAWDEVLSESGIPKYAGYCSVLTDSFLFEVKSSISVWGALAYSKDVETRAEALARKYLENKIIASMPYEERMKISKVMAAVNKMDETEVKKIKDEIVKILS